MRGLVVGTLQALGLTLVLGGCDPLDDGDELGAEDLEDIELRQHVPQACGFIPPPPDPLFHVPGYDCSESQDTGYDAGTPFQITVVTMDGEPVEKDTANAFWVMREAAAADGVDIHINSGFRTMAEQEYFYMCYQCGCCNNGNLAAQPGYSNHQSGHALDLNASAPGVYNWLAANGGAFGFTETVPSENWHWEWWGGGPGGGVCDIASPPTGSVDAATCDTITGWAQDPDAPEQSLAVNVVIDGAPGDPQAIELELVADQSRDDLCDALGSCNHAFEVSLPLGLRDDTPHSLRVFALDAEGEEDAELAVDPPELACPAPPLPSGVRRLLPEDDTFDVWQFSSLYDLAHVDAAALEELAEGPELGAAPFLVTDSAASGTWLVDKGVRRPIPSPEIAAAWHFDLATAVVLEDDQLADIPEGTPMRPNPLLATGDDGDIWLVDDPQAGTPGGPGGDGDGSGGDDANDDDGDGSDDGDDASSDTDDTLPGGGMDGEDSGCACTMTPAPHGANAALLLTVLAAARRRRRA